MQNFPLNIPINQTNTTFIQGRFLYYESGSAGGADASIKIVITGSDGTEVILKPGQGFRLADSYTSLTILNNKNQAGIIGNLVIDDGSFFDNRVVGNVEVIDGGKARTMAGGAFMGAASVAPGAGLKAVTQLWNPAGSGKNLIVSQLTANVGNMDGYYFAASQGNTVATIANGQSKKIGGAAAVGIIQCGPLAAVVTLGIPMQSFSLQAQSSYTFKLTEPIVIPPGYGLVGYPSAANNPAGASFEWYEEGIG